MSAITFEQPVSAFNVVTTAAFSCADNWRSRCYDKYFNVLPIPNASLYIPDRTISIIVPVEQLHSPDLSAEPTLTTDWKSKVAAWKQLRAHRDLKASSPKVTVSIPQPEIPSKEHIEKMRTVTEQIRGEVPLAKAHVPAAPMPQVPIAQVPKAKKPQAKKTVTWAKNEDLEKIHEIPKRKSSISSFLSWLFGWLSCCFKTDKDVT